MSAYTLLHTHTHTYACVKVNPLFLISLPPLFFLPFSFPCIFPSPLVSLSVYSLLILLCLPLFFTFYFIFFSDCFCHFIFSSFSALSVSFFSFSFTHTHCVCVCVSECYQCRGCVSCVCWPCGESVERVGRSECWLVGSELGFSRCNGTWNPE